MISKILQIPSLVTWFFAAAAIAFLIGAYIAKSGADELELHGADAQATITKKFQKEEYASGNSRTKQTVYIVEYDYVLNDGRRYNSSTRMKKDEWDHLKVGGQIPVRYSLQDPDKHQTHIGEYTNAVDTLMVFVWIFVICAFILLLYDIRQIIPGLPGRIGGIAYFFLCAGILSIAGAGLMRWSVTQTGQGLLLTTGTITKKVVTTGGNEKTSGAQSTIPKYVLSYTYNTSNGEQNEGTKAVSKDFYDEHEKGGDIIVIYRFHDTASHHIKSAMDRDAADGWLFIGFLCLIIGMSLYGWGRWRRGPLAPAT